ALNDQSILCVGYVYGFVNNQWISRRRLYKLDSLGNPNWFKEVAIDSFNSSAFGFIKEVPNDSNFYVSGYSNQTGQNHNFLAKITPNGDTIWTRIYSYPSFYGTISGMLVLQDQSIVTCGYVALNNDENVIARRVDSLGNTLWENIYQMPGAQRGTDITEMLDGSLVIAGSNDGDNLIMRIDFDGRLIEDTIISVASGTIRFQDVNVLHKNHVGLGILSRQASQNYGFYYHFDHNLLLQNTVIKEQGIYVGPVVSLDSVLFFSQFMSNDSFQINAIDFLSSSALWQINYGSVNEFKLALDVHHSNQNLICAGLDDSGSSQNYYIMKISGVGEEWIPDYCSYQPPVAGFEYEYNYPVLNLRDTSTGGLKYLDTVYTWQWNTSNGFSGIDDSLLVFFDSSTSSSIDIELVIGNWYGCRDTVNQTLVFGETGIETFKEFTVNIFPNPAKDELNIAIDKRFRGAVFKLYDLQGRLQLHKSLNQHSSTISISALPRSLYIFEIQSGEQLKRGKVVKN
ncbi:MAG: T9SS type A sorting domain-containing protein, partial [Cytophagales bacterium]